MRVLAEIIASDVSLLVTFNHAIAGVVPKNPRLSAIRNDQEKKDGQGQNRTADRTFTPLTVPTLCDTIRGCPIERLVFGLDLKNHNRRNCVKADYPGRCLSVRSVKPGAVSCRKKSQQAERFGIYFLYRQLSIGGNVLECLVVNGQRID